MDDDPIGNSAAPDFSDFAVSTQGRLLHFADLLCGDRGRAEDLVQGALVKVYLAWSKLGSGNPEAYARAIIAHAHIDWWRRKPSREIVSSSPPTFDVAAGDFAADVVARDAVLRALSVLTKRERTVIVLRYFYDLSEADIAREIGCATGTVKSAASRALTKLKANAHMTPEVAHHGGK